MRSLAQIGIRGQRGEGGAVQTAQTALSPAAVRATGAPWMRLSSPPGRVAAVVRGQGGGLQVRATRRHQALVLGI